MWLERYPMDKMCGFIKINTFKGPDKINFSRTAYSKGCGNLYDLTKCNAQN